MGGACLQDVVIRIQLLLDSDLIYMNTRGSAPPRGPESIHSTLTVILATCYNLYICGIQLE